jgi:hypothetical protein
MASEVAFWPKKAKKKKKKQKENTENKCYVSDERSASKWMRKPSNSTAKKPSKLI